MPCSTRLSSQTSNHRSDLSKPQPFFATFSQTSTSESFKLRFEMLNSPGHDSPGGIQTIHTCVLAGPDLHRAAHGRKLTLTVFICRMTKSLRGPLTRQTLISLRSVLCGKDNEKRSLKCPQLCCGPFKSVRQTATCLSTIRCGPFVTHSQ